MFAVGALLTAAACGAWRIDPVAPDALDDALSSTILDACALGRWTVAPVQPFDDVNSAKSDWGVEISRDGMRVVFSSNRQARPIGGDVVVPNVLPLKCASAAMEADARCHRGCGSMATG